MCFKATQFYESVVGVMKMGNIVSRAEVKSTSLAFQASVLPLHDVGSLMSPLYPCLPVLAERSVQTTINV